MSNKFFSFFSKDSASSEIKKLTPEMFSFLQQLPQALLLIDASGKIVFANEKSALLLKTEAKMLLSERTDRFGLTLDKIQQLLQDKTAQKQILDLVTFTADSFAASVGASILAQTSLVMITLESLPQIKQLSTEKEFLEGLVKNSPYALTVQTGGVCQVWNPQAEVLFGHKSHEVVGNPLYQFLPQDLSQSGQRLDQEVLASGQPRLAVQMKYKDAVGREKILSVSKVIVPALQGSAQALFTVYEDITERSQKEHDLLQTRTLLRAILDNVPLGIYTRDCNSEMTYYNKQSMSVFNEKPECVNSPHAYQTEEDLKERARREREILENGKIQDFPEYEYVDRDGNTRIIHMIKIPLMDAGPKPLVLTIVDDITKRYHQEKEIIRSNNFLSAIVQNAPIALYARGADGNMILRNSSCDLIFGAHAAEDFDEQGSLPHETQEQVREYIDRERQVLEDKKIIDIPEEEYIMADGTKRILHIIKVPVHDAEGKPQFVVTLAEDITRRKEQERSLMENANFLQALLDNIPVAIYARRQDEKQSFVNRRAHEMFPDEDEYKSNNDFYGAREEAIFKEGKIIEFPEEWYTTRRGNKILLHLTKVPVMDKEGKPFMVLSVAEDITDKKAQEKAILDAKNFLQMVIDNLPVSLSAKNYSGEYILWNKKSEELFGVSSGEVIGQKAYRKDINKEQAEFLRETDLRVFESKKEQNIPQELISTASEGVKIMHTIRTPLFNPDGTPHCLLTVSEDITAKTKMEKQIREASDKNTLLVENAREGVLILEDSKVIYANYALCNLLGYAEVKELMGVPVADLAADDHRMLLKEKYDAVLAGAENAASPIEIHFLKKNGKEVEAEFAAMASRYLGRRIVLCFVRDVTTSNRMLREVKTERENFRTAFEKCVTPAFILSSKGYISVMNEACRKMFNFQESDKNFYRNVYMRPAIFWETRRLLKQGLPAQMPYVFDFARAAAKFPDRIKGEGRIPLQVSFIPINKRDRKDGSVSADYVVFLEEQKQTEPPAPPPPAAPEGPKEKTPPPPPSPQQLGKLAQDLLILPNTEPYALCNPDWSVAVCNDLFCSLCQLKEDELVGQDLRKIFHQDSQLLIEEDFRTLVKDGSLANREYRINLASGLEETMVRLTAVKEADGRYLFVFRNLAFHLQIMKILEERSAQLNALLAATDGIVFSVFFDHGKLGYIEQTNKFLSKKLGYSHDELVHLPFSMLFTTPQGDNVRAVEAALHAAQTELSADGKTAFKLPVYKKDGSSFEAQVVLTLLDLPSKDVVLAVIHDLSQQLDQVAKESKEAKELQSVRQALPGLYLKTSAEGEVLEVNSNLLYLSDDDAKEMFLEKKPAQFWPEEAARNAVFSIKESLSVNVNTHFDFEWEFNGKPRFYEVTVTPITGRNEAVLWVKDVSTRFEQEARIRELYRITSEAGLSLTEQVDKVLAFGKKVFKADVGCVLRFEKMQHGLASLVIYNTSNDFNLERHMEFPIEECLTDVVDGNVVAVSDLGNYSCSRCIHQEKGFGSLIAAPLHVGGKVMGALCFASRESRSSFESSAEETIGIMAKLLSLRIELRQTGKMLSEASRSLARTLEYVEMPAVMIDLDYQITFVNGPLLQVTGRRLKNLMGRDFFAELIRNDDLSKRMFKAAEQGSVSGNLFQVRLDLLHESGLYEDTGWDVFTCKDENGEVDGYALIASAV